MNEQYYQLQAAHYGQNDWWDLPGKVYDSLDKAQFDLRWWGGNLNPDDEWVWMPGLQFRIVSVIRMITVMDRSG